MVVIKNQTFESDIISPEHSSSLQDAKMENKQIVADNVRVQSMKLDFNIMYTNKNLDETQQLEKLLSVENGTDEEILKAVASDDYLYDDYRDKKLFLEDILYRREVVDIFDSTENINYGNMVLTSLGSWVFYPNGFSCRVGFTYAAISQTATEGTPLYKGVENRNIKYTERPLKQVILNADSIPSDSLGLLGNMGITPVDGILNFESLNIDTDNFFSGLGDSVLSTLGNNRLNFSVMASGAMDILSDAGEYLLAGQDLIMNSELLANMIPGVNFSSQLIPITDKALNSVFEVEQLGKGFELVINEIKDTVGDLIGT